jgi:predicted ATP-binding protein involved in virulence
MKEELKNKYTERAKIFQQAMESCHSSSPIDCIEWFADKIAELEKENAELKEEIDKKQHLADVRLEQELETYQKFHIKSREKLDTEIALDELKDQLTKAKDHIKKLLGCLQQDTNDPQTNYYVVKYMTEAEQFIKASEVEK